MVEPSRPARAATASAVKRPWSEETGPIEAVQPEYARSSRAHWAIESAEALSVVEHRRYHSGWEHGLSWRPLVQ
jgi:hypothetical protein